MKFFPRVHRHIAGSLIEDVYVAKLLYVTYQIVHFTMLDKTAYEYRVILRE